MTQYLFNLNEEGEGETPVEVRPNLWLMTEEEVPPLLFTVERAAHCLGLDVDEVSLLIRSGELGSITVGSSRRVPARALREFVRSLDGVD